MTELDVTVGPFAITFGNANTAMGLKPHHHHAHVHLTYRCAPGEHGYPSFKITNDQLRARLREVTGMFEPATNEDVTAQLFTALDGFHTPEMDAYGGQWHLTRLDLDVHSVLDSIGHDEGTTRYTYTR